MTNATNVSSYRHQLADKVTTNPGKNSGKPDPAMKFVGVNYGSGNMQITEVVFYADDQCKYAIGGPIDDAEIGDGEAIQKHYMGMRVSNYRHRIESKSDR